MEQWKERVARARLELAEIQLKLDAETTTNTLDLQPFKDQFAQWIDNAKELLAGPKGRDRSRSRLSKQATVARLRTWGDDIQRELLTKYNRMRSKAVLQAQAKRVHFISRSPPNSLLPLQILHFWSGPEERSNVKAETSAFAAMIDLIGDSLLTFAAVLGLIVGGVITWPLDVAAGIVLIPRDLVVASLNEALPGNLGPRVGPAEKVKIIAAFSALTLLIAPTMFAQQQILGLIALWMAAVLTVSTVVGYWLAALKEFAKG